LYERGAREAELCPDYRRDVSETPIFIACGREADFRKAREGIFSQLSQPRDIPSRGPPLKVGEILEMNS